MDSEFYLFENLNALNFLLSIPFIFKFSAPQKFKTFQIQNTSNLNFQIFKRSLKILMPKISKNQIQPTKTTTISLSNFIEDF